MGRKRGVDGRVLQVAGGPPYLFVPHRLAKVGDKGGDDIFAVARGDGGGQRRPAGSQAAAGHARCDQGDAAQEVLGRVAAYDAAVAQPGGQRRLQEEAGEARRLLTEVVDAGEEFACAEMEADAGSGGYRFCPVGGDVPDFAALAAAGALSDMPRESSAVSTPPRLMAARCPALTRSHFWPWVSRPRTLTRLPAGYRRRLSPIDAAPLSTERSLRCRGL
jgi:hypothetical protein